MFLKLVPRFDEFLMADTATFSGALKTRFLGPIRDNLYKGRVLLYGDNEANPTDFKGILGSAENINMVGNEWRMPYKAKRNNSVGFRHENETLPAPGAGEYTYLQEPIRHAYALFNITGQLMKAGEAGEGAFISAFRAEMDDTTLSSKLDMDRAAHGDGTGKMATVTTGGAGTTIIVDTTIAFRGGEIVDFVTSAGVCIAAACEVASINRSTRTLTFTAAVGGTVVAGTHFPVRASRDSTTAIPNNSLNREINGLANIVSDTGVLHGLNPTTYPWWKSYVDTSGGPITDQKFRAAKDAVGFETGLDVESGLDFAILTTRGIRSRYADTLVSLKRFNDAQSTTLRGGFDALMFDNNPIFVDDGTAPGTVYGLALNKMLWIQMADWDWMEEDGKVLKWESRKDRYIAVLYKYCNLGTTHRGGHFKLTGITDDVR